MKHNAIPLIRIFLLAFSLLITREAYAQKNTPYAIEHGTLTYQIADGKKCKKMFVNSGLKFREEYYDLQGRLYQIELFDGDTLYSYMVEKRLLDNMGAVRNPSFGSYSEARLKKKPKFQKAGTTTIVGKTCQQYQYYEPMLKATMTVATWNNIDMETLIDGRLLKKVIAFDPSEPQSSLFNKTSLN